MRGVFLIVAVWFGCALCGGCSNGTAGAVEPGLGIHGDPFRAVTMRLHPLTRLVRENGVPVRVDAHVEFFDSWGHTVKALGVLRFELGGAAGRDGDPSRSAAEPVRWDAIDLSNPGASSRVFDPATGTYWLRLALPGEVTLGGSPRLEVVFTSVDGYRWSSSFEIE